MSVIRSLLIQRHFAALLCAATLLMKLVVPGGYMIASDHGRPAIMLCSGVVAASGAMAMPGMDGDMAVPVVSRDHGEGHRAEHGKGEMPCAFGSLVAAALDAIGPVWLTAPFAAAAAAGLSPHVSAAAARNDRRRPPPRGPPPLR